MESIQAPIWPHTNLITTTIIAQVKENYYLMSNMILKHKHERYENDSV